MSISSKHHSIAADYEDRFIYWVDESNDDAGIYKSTNEETVASLDI